MGTITNNSSSFNATAYGNQRKIDRCQNGVLWTSYSYSNASFSGIVLFNSTDNGATWTQADVVIQTATANVTSHNGSIFIDLDDYAHVTYKNPSDGLIYYKRGTPNATRTAFTWSAATFVTGAFWTHPDIVAHRNPATPGTWVAHVVASSGSSGSTTQRWGYWRASISSTGTVTEAEAWALQSVTPTSITAESFASIDFNHTGDGKTVAAGTPNLYVGWSAGQTGVGYGIRFRKATYSPGSWTWGIEREIDNTVYCTDQYQAPVLFDGTRAVIAGFFATASGVRTAIFERDAADTTTTTRYSDVPATGPAYFLYGSNAYDSAGNVYILGVNTNNPKDLRRLKWERATNTAATTTLATIGSAAGYVSARRGWSGQALDYTATTGSGSPYTLISGRITLNQNPTAPDLLTPADNATFDSSAALTVTFKHNDPDGDAASSYRIRYRPAGCTSAPYAYLTGSTSAANAGTVTVTVAAGTWVGQVEWAAQTYDPSGAEGSWSVTRTATGVPSALAALTGGQGGTSADALKLYDLVQSERALRALALV